MGISLSWRMPASTQYLKGYLAELENSCFYAVPEWVSALSCRILAELSWRMLDSTQYLNGYLAELENSCFYAVPEWVSR
jgi:hypothetical protein